MDKLKILTLIEHLTEKEKESIRSFLAVNLSDNKKDCLNIYENIVEHPTNCHKAMLWKSVYPKQKIDEQKFRKLCFETLQEIEKGLSVHYLLEHQVYLQHYLIRYYLENNLSDFFSAKIEKARKHSDVAQKCGAEAYLHQYQTEHLYFLFLQKQENVQSSLNIAASSDGLDKFYFSQKLKYICNTLNYKAILGKTEPVAFEDELILLLQHSTLKDDLLISIYYAIYFLLKQPEEEAHFKHAKELLIAHSEKVEHTEFSDMIQYLINYCIKRINQSANNYLDELFEIYQLYLKKTEEKVFSPIRFKNIFLLALKMKRYEWAELFIDTYGNKLPKEQRETTIAYNKARLYYDRKQYDKVLDTLLNLHHEEVQFNLISKVLIVKTFYEKNEIQFLENFMLSFKAYILRNKEMNTVNKQIHLNFLKMMKKLIGVEYSSKAVAAKFRQKIETFNNLPDKNWFLEKIDAL